MSFDHPNDEDALQRQPLDSQRFLRTFEQFVKARTWSESQRIVEQHPELLSDEANQLVETLILIARIQNNTRVAQTFEEYRALLSRCREMGIETAFRGKTGSTSSGSMDIPSQFRSDLQQAQEAEQRYQRTGDRSVLDAAAAAWERILHHPSFPACDDRFRPAVMNGAADIYLRRYWSVGQLADLDRALELWRRAVNLTAESSPDLPVYLNNLAGGLIARYFYANALADLDEAIGYGQRTVELLAEDSPNLPSVLGNLAKSLRTRYLHTHNLADLEQAIGYGQQAVNLTAEGSPDLPSRLNNLASGLRDRYARTGALQDLQDAIGHWQRAVNLTTEGSPDWTSILSNLAGGLTNRYLRTGDLIDLQAAIGHWQQVVELTAESSPDLPGFLNNLAVGLSIRYARVGALTDLQAAIGYGQRAVELTTAGSPDLPMHLNNLADGLSTRYMRTGDLADLQAAIGYWQQAVELTTASSPDLPMYLNNLANGLRSRYLRTRDLIDLEKAIENWQRTVDLTAEGSPNLPAYLNNLTGGLRDRYLRTRDLTDLQAAIDYAQRAIKLTAEGSPNLPAYLNNLAGGLISRYLYIRDLVEAVGDWQRALELTAEGLRDLQIAIYCEQRAVELTTEGTPDLPVYLNSLAGGLVYRYSHTKDLVDLEKAQAAYRHACKSGQLTQPEAAMVSSRGWGNWALERRAWREATEAYDYSHQAIDLLFATQTSRTAKESWLKEVQGLPANAAYALAKLGRLEEAVKVLEAGRARLLAEALEQNRRDLEHLDVVGHGDLLARYRTASEQLVALQQQAGQPDAQSADRPIHQPDYTAWRQQIEQARAEVDAAIAAIRGVPGYEDFFLAPSFERIQQAAMPDAPLVYLATTPAGSVAPVVTAASQKSSSSEKLDFSPVTTVWLDGFTETDLDAILFSTDDEGRYLQGAFGGDPDALQRTLNRALPQLGEKLMAPLAAALHARGVSALSLVATGRLALLPLHAAPIAEGQTFLDRFDLAYTPSATALRHNQGSRAEAGLPLLAVGNPNPHRDRIDIALLFTQLLVDEVATRVPGAQALARQEATVQSVQAALQHGPAHLLFGGHGVYEIDDPLQSGLELADGRLTLKQLLDDTRLPATGLAVLCACQSSLSDFRNLPDEAVGLPAGFLQAGAKATIGTLWPVDPLPTVLLLRRFYDHWLDGIPPLSALRQAVSWLATLDQAGLHAEVAALVKRADPGTAFQLEGSEIIYSDPQPFASPTSWAAFTYNGAP